MKTFTHPVSRKIEDYMQNLTPSDFLVGKVNRELHEYIHEGLYNQLRTEVYQKITLPILFYWHEEVARRQQPFI